MIMFARLLKRLHPTRCSREEPNHAPNWLNHIIRTTSHRTGIKKLIPLRSLHLSWMCWMERNWALLCYGGEGERVQHSAALTSCRIIPEKLSRGCVVDFLSRLREFTGWNHFSHSWTMSWRSGKTTMSEALHVSRLSELQQEQRF